LKYFSLLAACELAGALGLVLGIWLPWARQAAGVGLVIYFVGAVVSHLRVRDIKDIGPALFMLMVAAGARPARVACLSQATVLSSTQAAAYDARSEIQDL
jgi:hypothetical protein